KSNPHVAAGPRSKGRTRIFREALRDLFALYLSASDFRAGSRGARTAATGKLCRAPRPNCPCTTRFFRKNPDLWVARRLRTQLRRQRIFRLSLTGIASAALSTLQTNSTALRVVSNNVANMNTVGYARRTVQFQTAVTGNQIG